MYSPKIKEEYIPVLYQIAKFQKRPMTRIVNEMIEQGIRNIDPQDIERHISLREALEESRLALYAILYVLGGGNHDKNGT